MACNVNSIGIIGYGRFGALVHTLLAERLPRTRFRIFSESQSRDCKDYAPLEETAGSDILIPCVPIKSFESTIKRISPLISANTMIVDVCSVKLHPRKVMQEQLPAGTACLATHPMFGPGTYQKRLATHPDNPLHKLTVVVDKMTCPKERYQPLLSFLKEADLHVVEMDSDEHDRLASRFQFVCLTTASILKTLDIQRSDIDTESASLMMDYLEMISVDKQLVKDLYNFNPYCAHELKTFGEAFNSFVAFLEGDDS